MTTVFWDRKGVLTEFMQHGTTMSEVYCEEEKKKLHRAIQNKRCRMLTYSAVLLHDNVHLHTAAQTLALLEHFNWELFDHPPYSPHFTPIDYHLNKIYHLFTYLKNWL
jgi:transposase